MDATTIGDLDTPCLLLCRDRLDRNMARLREAVEARGAVYRPHLKTAKSVPLAHHVLRSMDEPVTVSTLKEAEVFADAGLTNMIYAVGIAPGKIERIGALRRRGVDIAVLLDSVEQARMLATGGSQEDPVPALIEIDCDGHRSGVAPGDSTRLKSIAAELTHGAALRGVLTHCGSSYGSSNPDELAQWAMRERDAALEAAALLRRHGYAVPGHQHRINAYGTQHD